jgi:hypothetical protein
VALGLSKHWHDDRSLVFKRKSAWNTLSEAAEMRIPSLDQLATENRLQESTGRQHFEKDDGSTLCAFPELP